VEEVPDIDPAPAPGPFSGTKRPSEARGPSAGTSAVPDDLKDEIREVLRYMDHLLEALPEDKIQEFASSDYFVMYKKLFEELGLGE
jgi:pilus assembly protein FimV